MANKTVVKQLHVKGMTCGACEMRIEKKLRDIDGVAEVKADSASGRVSVTYDESKVDINQIKQAITAIDYEVSDTIVKSTAHPNEKVNYPQIAVIAIIVFAASMLINRLGGFGFFNYFPEATEGMSYAAIFVIGLFTSVHCVGMCGGICLSQCVAPGRENGSGSETKTDRIRPSLLYNMGRVISYTAVGAIVGALGSVISFNGFMRGAVALLAGIIMIVMGLNMLNIFPWLKRFRFGLPKSLTNGLQGKSNRPLYIGLLNGLMPCGPLQAMQIYALSTGSPVQGAISMFLFALGTSPLLFGFGAASSLLSKKFTAKMMTACAVLVIVLGVGMFNTGLSMSGFLGIGTETANAADFQPVIEDGYQIVTIEVSRRAYAPITVVKDIPVKFNLHAEAENINGCNNAIIIPEYGIQKALQPGDNIVEFTPTEAGIIPYSCWMNMIKSSITIVEDINDLGAAKQNARILELTPIGGGGCCGGGN